jgi:hypothetical protein
MLFFCAQLIFTVACGAIPHSYWLQCNSLNCESNIASPNVLQCKLGILVICDSIINEEREKGGKATHSGKYYKLVS